MPSLDVVRAAGSLRELHFGSDREASVAARLAGCSALTRLEVLDLRGTTVRDDIEDLAASTYLRGLRALCLADAELSAGTTRAIGHAFPELRVLDLSNNKLGTKGWLGLGTGGGLDRLADLRLASTTINGDESIRALESSPLLGRLRSLDLRDNHISDGGLQVLAASAQCGQLSALDVRRNPNITTAGLTALKRSRHLEGCKISHGRAKRTTAQGD